MPCTYCSGPANGACPRCQKPLCQAHLPGAGRRCTACERTYRERRVAIHFSVWWGMPFLLLLVFFPWWSVDPSLPLGAGGYRLVATGDPRVDLILTVTLGAALIAAGVLAVRVFWERRSFLNERKA